MQEMSNVISKLFQLERVKEWRALQNSCLCLQILPTDASVMQVFHYEIMLNIQSFHKTYRMSQIEKEHIFDIRSKYLSKHQANLCYLLQ